MKQLKDTLSFSPAFKRFVTGLWQDNFFFLLTINCHVAIHSTFSHGPSTLALPNMIGFAFFNVYGRDRPSVCLFSAAEKV